MAVKDSLVVWNENILQQLKIEYSIVALTFAKLNSAEFPLSIDKESKSNDWWVNDNHKVDVLTTYFL